nr:GON-4-like protein isoform X2 [Oncorhynchus nerka]XP_029479676.1 GON-4-like protein isoform X2 [Oncorhynchus nerka]XP_029479685.1 GON-4-like protein isoform X2 [Oncorhynchus nerka]XP_029479695.1 GON-4-like protein isoform X2 [Oncorhynchus nerka]
MTKTAIQEMLDLALFEPKMTRSRLKEGSIPTWNISPIKRALEVKPPQFVDIPLEEEDDSSDEEYCLDKEDETAEEVRKSFIFAPLVNQFCSISQKGVLCDYNVMPVTLSFWSDVDITGSSPCCAQGARPRTPGH